MLDWFRDPGLCQRVQAGLNKGEARNALGKRHIQTVLTLMQM